MEQQKEVELPSGAKLKITLSPFAVSKALYMALLEEAKGLSFNTKMEVGTLYKDIFCAGFSSPKIEKCIWACLERCTYNTGNGDLRITQDTFEPANARQDYLSVCMEVAQENVGPFMKSLYAEFRRRTNATETTPA